MKEHILRVFRTYGVQLILGAAAIPVGLAVGVMDAVFGRVLLAITAFRDGHALQMIPFLAAAGAVIAFAYQKFGGRSSKGMNLIFEVGHGRAESIPLRLIPFIAVSTWLTHLFGGSAGREGVAVQIGAAFSNWAGRKLPIKNSGHVFLVTGMAAGFAGLFGTPMAAVFFAMEVLTAGALEYQALLPAAVAAYTASTTSRFLGLEKFEAAITADLNLNLSVMVRLLALGIIFGIVGGAFAWGLKTMKGKLADVLGQPVVRIVFTGVILSIALLLLHRGRYAGLGTNLITAGLSGGKIYVYDWVAKFIFTIVTLSAGFQGGEVTPLFSIGASLGAVLAPLFGMSASFGAALGYTAVFSGATNTFLAPVMIGAEVFGFEKLPYFFIACAAAYAVNMDKSIYALQKILASGRPISPTRM